DKGLDTGAVWTEARLPITADDTAASLHDRLMTLGSATLLRTLPDVLAQTRQPTPQAADGITYAHKLNKAEARLDWHAPVATLDRKIRAYNPTPIAHTTLDGEALRIHAAHVLNHHPAAAPGTITAHHADGLDVACADGTLRITRLQLPGKTATDAAALRHSRDLTGQQLQ
ncbi:MAG: methionyl-tRNA formyltransferase, partial [Cardiobacterium hominis]